MTKYVFAGLGLAMIAGLFAVVDLRSRPLVTISPVAHHAQRVFAPGRVEGVTENIELRPSASGRLMKLLVEEGQSVAAGDVLLEIESDEPRHQVELAAAEVAIAESELLRLNSGVRQAEKDELRSLLAAKQAELQRAELHWQRTKTLRDSNVSTAQEADQQRTEVDIAKALVATAQARYDLALAPPRDEDVRIAEGQVRLAQSRLGLAQARLDRTRLKALTAGRVMKINVQAGEFVGPDAQEPAIVVCDTRILRVRAFIEEFEVHRVSVGATVSVKADGLSSRKWQGTVSRLAPQMTNKELWSDSPVEKLDTKVREVWIDLDQAGDLVPGLPVEVSIDLSTPANQVAAVETISPAIPSVTPREGEVPRHGSQPSIRFVTGH